ncbi:MAG: hypothetical protein M1816_000642 [Peltula sp. TS41687]|nr:MAG: hypothetical protein M1816_000642 [Peltula sp. TS41687]
MTDYSVYVKPPPEDFPEDLKHTRETQIFIDIWEDSNHPRHRQYHDAIHPKLWACRCSPVGNNQGDGGKDVKKEDEEEAEEERPEPCQYSKDYEIIAYLGGGAAGRVWAASKKVVNPDGSSQNKFYAIKIEKWADTDRKNPASATVRFDSSVPDRAHIRLPCYVKLEALIQNMVGDMSANIPEVVEVFSHKPYVIIVSNLVGYKHEDRLNTVPMLSNVARHVFEDDDLRFHRFPHLNQCSGDQFEDDHTPFEMRAVSDDPGTLSLGEKVEAQMCMVFHGLLQAFHHMFDRGVTHLDFEGRNVLVDENFQGYLIDFSMSRPNGCELDFHFSQNWSVIRQHHDPEFHNHSLVPLTSMPRDGRRIDLWSFASVLYLLLHKTHPKRYRGYQENKFRSQLRQKLLRKQMSNPLDVRENLSQDCADVLQATLNIFPLERPDVEELCTFPWFSGWQYDSEVDFTNPKMTPYTEFCPDRSDRWSSLLPAGAKKAGKVFLNRI